MVADELNELKSRFKTQELKMEQFLPHFFMLKNELMESKKEYSDLYNYSSSIYFTVDRNYIIQTLNFQAAILLGMDRKQLYNKLFLNFITNHSHQIFKSSIETLYEKECKQICDIQLISKGGHKRSVTLQSTLIKGGLIHLCLSDNTNSRASTQQLIQLQQSLNLTNYLFHLSSDAIAALDKELLRIPLMSINDSERCRSLIPIDGDQRFQSMPIKPEQSDA